MCILRILYYCMLCVSYYICNKAQQNLRARFDLTPPPGILILIVPRRFFCCGFLLLLVLAVHIVTLVHLLC